MPDSYELDPKKTWPLPVKTKAVEVVIHLNKLDREERALVWNRIENTRPDIAELLESMKKDEKMQQILNYFDATLAIYDDDLNTQEAHFESNELPSC